MTTPPAWRIRPAEARDLPDIDRLVRELAVYEREPDAVEARPEDFAAALFGPQPRVFCHVAELADGTVAGIAVWYETFSTWEGRHGIWLEDLFVVPEARGRGIGKALLVELARRCVHEELGRLEWAVLDWNQPSIDFYEAQGAIMLADWERCRLHGEALQRLGS